MYTQVNDLSSIGLISDLDPWDLPINAWSSLANMRCSNKQIGTFAGYSDFTTPSIVPYFLMPAASGSDYHWIYCGQDKIYAYNGSSHTNITRQTASVDVDYTGTVDDLWNGCTVNSIPVLNNGVDDPQMWSPPNISTKLTIIPGWDVNWKTKFILSHKGFLLAFNLTKSGTSHPNMVKWSASDQSGSIPTDWDETDDTNDAGENDHKMGDTTGALVCAYELGDIIIAYKEDAAYTITWIGGESIFRIRRIAGITAGVLSQRCVVEYPGGHFVVGIGDVYRHNGRESVSVMDDANKEFLFASIDVDNYLNTFCVHLQKKKEIWICYPDHGEVLPNKALVWNYSTGAWSYRDLPSNTTYITKGILTSPAYTWETLPPASWDDWTGVWGQRSYSPVSRSLVGATSDTKLFQFEDGNQMDGVNTHCAAERTGLDLGNSSDLHTVVAIYPYIDGSGPVNVSVGGQMTPGGVVEWADPVSFNPSTDVKVDVLVTGVMHGIKFESTDDIYWALSGYGVEYEYAGGR
jgi:hypothetical protein